MRPLLSSSILAVSLFVPALCSASFKDVPTSYPYYDAIQHMQERHIVEGYPDGTFRPDKTVNRAELVKIITFGTAAPDDTPGDSPEPSPPVLPFADVQAGDWFYPTVAYVFTRHWVQGYADGLFHPERTINFAEAAKIISNAFEMHLSDGTSVWYETYVRALAEKNAIPTTIHSFDQQMTRGEVAEIFWRLDSSVTDRPSKTYDDLLTHYSYLNTTFDYGFHYPSDQQVMSNESNRAVQNASWITLNSMLNIKAIPPTSEQAMGPHEFAEHIHELNSDNATALSQTTNIGGGPAYSFDLSGDRYVGDEGGYAISEPMTYVFFDGYGGVNFEVWFPQSQAAAAWKVLQTWGWLPMN